MSLPIPMLAVIPTLQGGGAERVMLTLLRHIDRSRFGPTLVVIDGRQRDLARDLPDGIEVLDLGCTRVRHAAWTLWKVVRQRRPRVLLSTLGHLNLMLAMLRPTLPGTLRMVGREASIVSENLGETRHPALWRAAYRLFYRRLDLVVCQSRAMQSDLCGPLRFPQAKTVVIANPVDIERVRRLAADGAPVQPVPSNPAVVRLVAAGRLSREKGFDLLLHALALCPELPCHLDLLGQGPEETALRHLAETLGLSSRVRFHGFVANPYPWFRQADALVLSSRYEGQPNVVLEAMACGTPAICTPVPSAREILEGRPECVVADQHTPEALAAAVRAWCAGPRGRVPEDALADQAAKRVVQRYEEVLERVAGTV